MQGAVVWSMTFIQAMKWLPTCFTLFVVGCGDEPTARDSPTQEENMAQVFTITDSDKSKEFVIKSAKFNTREFDHGHELTFSVESVDSDEMFGSPFFEVTVHQNDAFEIAAGSNWRDQPGFIDSPDLQFMSLLYYRGHEQFEWFSVEVLDSSPGALRCRISGTVAGHSDVALEATFVRDEELARDAER